MSDIVVLKTVPPIDWAGVPVPLRGKFSAVVRSLEDAENLVHWYGDARFAPELDIIMDVPGQGWTPVIGAGVTPAAELRDLCVTTWHRALERIAENDGETFDWDTLREKHGYMRREHREAAFAEALMERRRQHQQNERTDPSRQMDFGESDKMVFDMGEKNDG